MTVAKPWHAGCLRFLWPFQRMAASPTVMCRDAQMCPVPSGFAFVRCDIDGPPRAEHGWTMAGPCKYHRNTSCSWAGRVVFQFHSPQLRIPSHCFGRFGFLSSSPLEAGKGSSLSGLALPHPRCRHHQRSCAVVCLVRGQSLNPSIPNSLK